MNEINKIYQAHMSHELKLVVDPNHAVLKIGGTLIIGDTYLPVIARQVMNYFIRFNKDGDVRIYSKKEMISFLEELFHEIKWIKVSNSAYMIKGVK